MNPQDLFNSLIDPISRLYSRWQDEYLYEDIAEYGKALEKAVPSIKIVKCFKRPFGFQFTMNDLQWKVQVQGRKMKLQKINQS